MKSIAHSGSFLNDPAGLVKSQSRIVSFEGSEIWFCGGKVVVDSRVPLPELKLREFARPRIVFEAACYYVSEKSQSSTTRSRPGSSSGCCDGKMRTSRSARGALAS